MNEKETARQGSTNVRIGFMVTKNSITVIKKTVAGVLFVETLVPCLATALLAILIGVESLLRYAFSYSIFQLEAFTVLIGMYAYYFGAAMASRNSGHIRVTIIDSIPLSSHARCLINVCTGFISSGVCFIFAYYILKDTLWAISAGITLPALGWPAAIQELSLAIGLGLMALHHLEQSVRALWKA